MAANGLLVPILLAEEILSTYEDRNSNVYDTNNWYELLNNCIEYFYKEEVTDEQFLRYIDTEYGFNKKDLVYMEHKAGRKYAKISKKVRTL